MSTTATSPLILPASEPATDLHLVPQQVILALLLLYEIAIFGAIGDNFLSLGNLRTVSVQTVELGLIALALTPVILTGGIDLSVASLIGLSAVLFGKLCNDAGLPPLLAGCITIALATLGGGLNALLITRGRIPPLIVTLGTFSLYRGIAEGITRGQGSFTRFPESFLFLGKGAPLGLPTQLWVFIPAAIAFFLFVHRSRFGRALSAIGFSAEGARHAGIRTDRLIATTYITAGFCSGLAALIYVARLGEAKADAALGYELLAITAVVLGGTSIFGGRASIIGTLLGLAAIALLKNGLRLAHIPDFILSALPTWLGIRKNNLPPELAGVLTGLILLVTIALDFTHFRGKRAASPISEELNMRNSQLAVLCAVIIAAALLIAGGNFMLVNSLRKESGGPVAERGTPTARKLVVALMPKSKGNAYFIACQHGAEQAAKDLNVELIWDGPTSADPAEQNMIVETWITKKVDVIGVAVENAGGLSTALKKARDAGIKVVTWDADANPDARDFFCNQATPDGIGDTMMETAAKEMGGEGKFVIISGSQTAANLNLWRDRVLKRLKDFPKIQCVETVYCDDKQNLAMDEAKQMLNKYPDLKLILANCSPAVPGAAEAVKQTGRAAVKVIGLGLPNENKMYVHEGITRDVILWNTGDLGYLAVAASKAVHDGTLKPGDTTFNAGKLGKLAIEGTSIILGKPFVFTKDNIDQFDF